MPKNRLDYLKDYKFTKAKVQKRRKNKPKNKWFIVFMSVCFIAILIFFAGIFSSVITPGMIPLNRGERYFLEQNLYAVELTSCDNRVKAQELSDTYKNQLAAGYIVNEAGTYHILASCYKAKSSAESVVLNLKESNI